MVKKTVLVFDICSSTLFLEDLKIRNMTDEYKNLIKKVTDFLEENCSRYEFDIYKFLGDGYILLFPEETKIDKILLFVVSLTENCKSLLENFRHEYIQTAEDLKEGITIGLDKGELLEIKLNRKPTEYIGRAINIACRLQTKLSESGKVNWCLMTNDIYSKIIKNEFKKLCTPLEKKLKNINNNKAINCYELYPTYYKNADPSVLRESKQDTIKEDLSNKLLVIPQIQKVYEMATVPSSIETINEFINPYEPDNLPVSGVIKVADVIDKSV